MIAQAVSYFPGPSVLFAIGISGEMSAVRVKKLQAHLDPCGPINLGVKSDPPGFHITILARSHGEAFLHAELQLACCQVDASAGLDVGRYHL